MTNQAQTQYEKNPNGGYLNKSNYGEDSWYGNITITPQLLAEIQQTGKVLIEVKDVQTTQYGECRRIVGKTFVPKEFTPQAAPTGAAPAQVHAPAAPAPAQVVVAPAAVAQPVPDDIPF